MAAVRRMYRWSATALVAVVLVTGMAAADAEALTVSSASSDQRWFRIVDSIPGAPLAVAAPAPNDVWVALWTGEGLAMGRYDLVQWQVTPVLPGRTAEPEAVRSSSDRPAVLQAAGPDDIWLAAGGGVAHYDGAAWQEITGPTDARGRVLDVTTVAVAAGRVYVGTRDADLGAQVWRRTGDGWAALGGPPSASGETVVPREIKIMGGTIMAQVTRSSASDSRDVPEVWWHDGRRWSSLYRFQRFEMFTRGHQTAWIVRDDWRHLFFGWLRAKGAPDVGTCHYAHAPGMTRECQTGPAVSAAAQLRDRTVVLGAGSWSGVGGLPRPGPDQLLIRHLDGSEMVVGQASFLTRGVPLIQVAVEPDGMTVWAVTELGLQRLAPPS